MPSGRLGVAALPANSYKDICTIPAGEVATVSVNFFNSTAAEITVELSFRGGGAADSAPGVGERFDALKVPPGEPRGWNGVPVSPGERVTARASAVGIDAQVRGFSEVQ